jgi:plasmid maintenance system antidote protein VapI
MSRLNRRDLGENFCEGSRRLWLAMAERGLDQTGLANLLGTKNSQVNRWLYGERKAGRMWADRIFKALGIERDAWDREPAPFSLKALQRQAEVAAQTAKSRAA